MLNTGNSPCWRRKRIFNRVESPKTLKKEAISYICSSGGICRFSFSFIYKYLIMESIYVAI